MTTLKASAGQLGGLLAYYAGLAEDQRAGGPGPRRGPVDYYLDPDEPPGRWHGRGRHGLGFDREVEPGELRAVLEGLHPQTGRSLGRRFGDSSARGFDATFSAPKSVSVLWALTPDRWVRAEVLAAHDAAVTAALDWLEVHGAVTRRGKDGVDQVDTQGLTVAVFRQHTSRTVDPQLHTHAVIAGKVQDPTGRWLCLDARFSKQQQRTIGWVYDAALRTELTSRLGVAWGPVEGGQADIVQVPEEARTLFSHRSVQVEEKLGDLVRRWVAEHDGADPDPRTIAGLERKAVLSSRPAKEHDVDPDRLFVQWADRARTAGIDPAMLTASDLRSPRPAAVMTNEQIVDEALRRVADESSTWLTADLARHIATLLPPHGLTAGDLTARIDQLTTVAEARCVPLGPDHDGPSRRDGRPVAEAVTDRRLTSAHVLDQEVDLQRWAEAAIANAPPVEPTADPQGAAAAAMGSHQRLVLVVGPAGTGKTTTTARAVQQLQAEGRPVVALAPSGKAADVLAVEAGCPAETLAAFLLRHEHSERTSWRPGTTVIVDEAAMATTDDLHTLIPLADRHHWRIVAVGDPDQLPAVGRGGVFAHWTNTLPAHHLHQPQRFTEPWEGEASLALRSGHPRAADTYDAHGRLAAAHPALAATRIAELHQRHTAAGQTVAITTNTAQMARRINVEVQRSRPRSRRHDVALADGTRAGPGDRIATRRNHPTLTTSNGEKVRNRHTWAVITTHPDGTLTVTDPQRGTVDLPADYVAQHVELGWAVTGYGNQGDTTDVGLAVIEPGTTRNHAYVALTRGRHTNKALLVDPTGTAYPAELLAAITAQSPSTDSALATRRRLGPGPNGRATVDTPARTPEDGEHRRRAQLLAKLDQLQHHDRGTGRARHL